MKNKKNPILLCVIYFSLALFWFGVMTEIVNQVADPTTGHGSLTYRMALAGLVLWALLENFLPEIAYKLVKILLLLSAVSTMLVYYYENTFTSILLGVCAGAVAAHAICRLAGAFPTGRRFFYLSIGIGFYSAAVALFFKIADIYFIFLDFKTALPFIFLLYAIIPLVLFGVSFKLFKNDSINVQEKTKEAYPLPSGKLVALGLLVAIALFACFNELIAKAFMLTADDTDPFLTIIYMSTRIGRVLLFPLVGLLIDKRKWRLSATIPVLCMVLGGAVSLLFNGYTATAIVLSLFGLGSGFVVYFVFLLPMMIAPRYKNSKLISILGVIFYWIICSIINATAVEQNLGMQLLQNKNYFFVAVTLLSIPIFLLILEFFMRQRNMELTQTFQENAVCGTLVSPPESDEISLPITPASATVPKEPTGFDTVAHEYMLTRRERELLPFLLSPMTAEEIANENYVSVNTVRTHIRNVLSKMQLSSRRELQKKLAAGVLASLQKE